jgi:hypothetical protein
MVDFPNSPGGRPNGPRARTMYIYLHGGRDALVADDFYYGGAQMAWPLRKPAVAAKQTQFEPMVEPTEAHHSLSLDTLDDEAAPPQLPAT